MRPNALALIAALFLPGGSARASEPVALTESAVALLPGDAATPF